MDNKLFFSCFSEDMKSYQLDLEFLHNIDTKESRYAVRPRVVEFKLAKQDREGPIPLDISLKCVARYS